MIISRIRYKLRNLTKIFQGRFRFRLNISSELILLGLIASFISIWLAKSIYSSINDIEKYRIYDQEKEHLDELVEENSNLKRERDYCKSEYYQQLYAREALGLAETDQELYYVDRGKNYDYEDTKNIWKKTSIKDNRGWWLRLIF